MYVIVIRRQRHLLTTMHAPGPTRVVLKHESLNFFKMNSDRKSLKWRSDWFMFFLKIYLVLVYSLLNRFTYIFFIFYFITNITIPRRFLNFNCSWMLTFINNVRVSNRRANDYAYLDWCWLHNIYSIRRHLALRVHIKQ